MSSITFLLSFLHTNFESAVTDLVATIVLCQVKQIFVAAVFQECLYDCITEFSREQRLSPV